MKVSGVRTHIYTVRTFELDRGPQTLTACWTCRCQGSALRLCTAGFGETLVQENKVKAIHEELKTCWWHLLKYSKVQNKLIPVIHVWKQSRHSPTLRCITGRWGAVLRTNFPFQPVMFPGVKIFTSAKNKNRWKSCTLECLQKQIIEGLLYMLSVFK